MERLVNDAAKVDSAVQKNNLTFANIVKAIHVVQTELGITGTTALEASTTIQGSVASMKSAWENLVTGIADENSNFEGLIDNFVNSARTAFDNIIPRIEQSLVGIANLIGKLAPIIIEKLPEIVPPLVSALVENATNLVNAFNDVLPELVAMIIPIIAEQAPIIMQVGIDLIKALVSGFFKAFADPNVVNDAKNAIIEIGELLISNGKEIIVASVELIKKLASGFVENAGSAIPFIIELLTDLSKFIIQNLGELIEPALQIVLTIGEEIVNNLPNIVDYVIEIIEYLVDILLDPKNLDKLLDGAIGIVVKLSELIVKELPRLIDAATEIIIKLIEFLFTKENLDKIVEAGIKIVTNLANAIMSGTMKLGNAAGKIISTLWDKIKSVDWLSLGSYMLNSIWNGVKLTWNGFIEWIENSVNSIYKKVLDAINAVSGLWGGKAIEAKTLLDLSGLKADIVSSNIGSNLDNGASAMGNKPSINFTQNIYSSAKSAADLAEETMWEAEDVFMRGLLEKGR